MRRGETMTKEQLGDFITQQRKAQGMTQKDLAQRLHVTDKAVSKWERGLSYPDVTLLEPLAVALGLNIEELMSCKEQETAMTTLIDISRDNLRRERLRRDRRSLAALILVCLIAAFVLYARGTVRETRENCIVLMEQTEAGSYIYVEEKGHLLKLKCTSDTDLEDVEGKRVYRITCRWDRRTYEGTASACEKTDLYILGTSVDQVGGAIALDPVGSSDTLFGYDSVFCKTENCYPNPYGTGYLTTYGFYSYYRIEDTVEERLLLKVKDCMGTTSGDFDGDGIMELLVHTRWPEKPYLLYDWVDGGPKEIWLDEAPAQQ